MGPRLRFGLNLKPWYSPLAADGCGACDESGARWPMIASLPRLRLLAEPPSSSDESSSEWPEFDESFRFLSPLPLLDLPSPVVELHTIHNTAIS